MDQVNVQAPAASALAASVEREFYSDFPLILNYAARLIDDIDDAASITCAGFRQVSEALRQREGAGGLRRTDVFRAVTELGRQSLRPKRWFRRRRRDHIELEGFPEPEARRALRRDTVQRAVGALSFESRVMVLLRDFAKLSYDEIAEIVDIPPRKLVHAMDRSRTELAEIYDYIKF